MENSNRRIRVGTREGDPELELVTSQVERYKRRKDGKTSASETKERKGR